jgi:hypothetical protein
MARRSEHSLEELKAMVLDAAEIIVIEEGFSALKSAQDCCGYWLYRRQYLYGICQYG